MSITEEEIRRLVSVVVDEAMAVKETDGPQNVETIATCMAQGLPCSANATAATNR